MAHASSTSDSRASASRRMCASARAAPRRCRGRAPMARIRDTDEVTDTRTLTGAVTVVGVFASGSAARAAIRSLERSGFPADRVGIVDDNVRNAREVAGSFSPQGALVGAMLGALLTAAVIVFGGESIRQNPASIALGGLVLIVAFT